MQKRIFKIDIVAVIFYIALAIAVLFAINFHTIWQFLASRTSGNTTVRVDYSAISPPLFNYLNKFGALTLMLFWAVVGTVCYILAIWIQMAFSSAFKEAKESSYVRPATDQVKYWRNTMISNLTILGLLVGWIVSLYVFVQLLLPRFSKLLNHSLNLGAFWQRAGYLAGAIILTAFCLFLIVKLGQLLKHVWRRFSAS